MSCLTQCNNNLSNSDIIPSSTNILCILKKASILLLPKCLHIKAIVPTVVRKDQYAGYLGEFLRRKSHWGDDLLESFVKDIAYVYQTKVHD